MRIQPMFGSALLVLLSCSGALHSLQLVAWVRCSHLTWYFIIIILAMRVPGSMQISHRFEFLAYLKPIH
jgi:hypothetical protein